MNHNKIRSTENILVVAAHPDDEILGCGGYIAKLVETGCKIHCLILSDITTSRNKVDNDAGNESSIAANILGMSSMQKVGFPDNRFDTIPLLDFIREIEKFSANLNPALILCHDYSDLNIDHRIVHQAVLAAFRPNGKNSPSILAFETLSSTECQDQSLYRFTPNYYVNIENFLDKKIEAIKSYKSELREYPHPRSLKGIEILAQKRGLEVGLKYAEAFRLIRSVAE